MMTTTPSARADGNFDLLDKLNRNASVLERGEFDFYGFDGHDLDINGVACKVVEPEKTAPGRPWVIRARFWGHEPQTDIALLKRGFHITYCDVADMYGSPAAVARWDSFYDVMRRAGMNRKVVLEGMSRGGLIIFNWAAVNPERVACMYADAPVMDLKSWPMGDGAYAGSPDDTRNMLAAYGFASAEQASEWDKNPVNHASVIARARIPMIIVLGDVDAVVPVAENSAKFIAALEKEGYTQNSDMLEVIHKPDVGHHPHSLKDPTPIVNFILKATGHTARRVVTD